MLQIWPYFVKKSTDDFFILRLLGDLTIDYSVKFKNIETWIKILFVGDIKR